MALTDPLGDMLTRIRNGQRAKKDSVVSPASKLRTRVLDVLQREPPEPANPLLARDDVVLTPHTASYIAETYDRMAEICARNALAGLAGHPDPAFVVNRAALSDRAPAGS